MHFLFQVYLLVVAFLASGQEVALNTNLFPYYLAFASRLSVVLLCLDVSAFSRFVYPKPKLQMVCYHI